MDWTVEEKEETRREEKLQIEKRRVRGSERKGLLKGGEKEERDRRGRDTIRRTKREKKGERRKL